MWDNKIKVGTLILNNSRLGTVVSINSPRAKVVWDNGWEIVYGLSWVELFRVHLVETLKDG